MGFASLQQIKFAVKYRQSEWHDSTGQFG